MWTAARLEPHKERLALYTLGLAGFTTYLPRIKDRRAVRGRWTTVTPALFPSYAFVLIEAQWHAARWSPGVLGLIMDGIVPARVPDRVIEEIRSRERDGLVELPWRLQPGDKVKVTRGLFAEAGGIFVDQKPRDRCLVLLAMLGATRQVALPAADVEAVR